MTPKRPTLRDRNREDIAAPTSPEPNTLLPSAPAAPSTAEGAAPHRDALTPPGAVVGERFALSISMRPEELEAAKAAYMADWMREGRYDGFPKWIGAAIRDHANLTPEQRAHIDQTRPPKQTKRGVKRVFLMDPQDVEILRQGIHKDLTGTGRYSSEANWCADALRVAVDRARARAGGVLPPAPSRLPNRMPERGRG